MTSLPITGPNQRTVYTGRTTSWPMVAATCVGALFVAQTRSRRRRAARRISRRGPT